MKSKAILLFTILALAVFAAGCGDGATLSDLNAGTTQATEETGSTEEASGDKSGKTVQPKISGKSGEKPEISAASGTPPEKLIEKDLKVGDGKTAKDGDEVTVAYVGHNWSNNEEFDASWGKDPFTFTLGQGQVIKGWDQGVVGMKEGGRRLLIIPPDLAYGEQGQGEIPPNETLIFVVDLEKVG